jgi:hypothetical protein
MLKIDINYTEPESRIESQTISEQSPATMNTNDKLSSDSDYEAEIVIVSKPPVIPRFKN